MKNAIRAAAAALLIALSAAASAQTVLYPIPEPQKEPRLASDYPVFVDRMIAQKDFEKALQYADAGLKQNPNNVSLAFKRGVILERLGRQDEARGVYEQLIRLYPEIPEPYNNLAILVADSGRGDLDHAIELLQRAVTANPRFHTALENLGDIYALKALQSYKAAAPAGSRAPSRKRIAEKITMLQIVTGNNPEETSAARPEAAAAARPEAVQKSAPKAAPAASAGSAAKPAPRGASRKSAATRSHGITETVEPIEPPALAPAASAPRDGVSASGYTASQGKSTLFRPLPEINP